MHFKSWSKTNMAEEAEEAVSNVAVLTTVKDLNQIITEPANGLFMLPSDDYNEVFEGILLGGE